MTTIAAVDLGDVDLPLAVEFDRHCRTLKFDLSKTKVESYARHLDTTGEVSTEDLKASRKLETLMYVVPDLRSHNSMPFE